MERGKSHWDNTDKDWTKAGESLGASFSEQSALGTYVYNSNTVYIQHDDFRVMIRNCRLGGCKHQL
jgi:hypothetical protein